MIKKDFKLNKIWFFFLAAILVLNTHPILADVKGGLGFIPKNNAADKTTEWFVGISRRVITPTTDVWLAGYGVKRPAEGKLTDIWVKVLALKSIR